MRNIYFFLLINSILIDVILYNSKHEDKYKNNYRSRSRNHISHKKKKYSHHYHHFKRSRSHKYHHHKYEKEEKKYKKHEKKEHIQHKENKKNEEKYKSDDDGKDRTKDAGHYKFKIGEIIMEKYKITKHISDGTFGRVFETLNIQNNQYYALKIIRAVERYVESAETEAEILFNMQRLDPENKNNIIKLYESFKFHENYCMVFEKLGLSLYDLLKKNEYRGYPIDLVQSFLKQILIGIGFMHTNKLTHTDLKPENILLVNEGLRLRTSISGVKNCHDSEEDDRSSTCSRSQKGKYYLPVDDKLKIIDFGGATYDYEHHSSVINTRQYRAPEIILACCEWDKLSDIWCIGCIVLELVSGDLFFETHDSYEHLAMIEKSFGHIPYWMCSGSEGKIKKHFNYSEDHYKKYKSYLDWPKYAIDKDSIDKVCYMKQIKEIIPKEHPELIDLLQKMLIIDPHKRIDCETALKHPFFSRIYPSSIFQE